jgi:hypothetical protein
MTQYLPTCRGSNDETLTQYDMKHTEMTGLIKFDFLGLKTLTVIDKALKHIKKDIGTELDIDAIPMDDTKTFDLLCRGDAQGSSNWRAPGCANCWSRWHRSSSAISSPWSPCTAPVPLIPEWSTISSRPSTAVRPPTIRCRKSNRCWRRPTESSFTRNR